MLQAMLLAGIGILGHPVTPVAGIAPRYAVNRFGKRQRNGLR